MERWLEVAGGALATVVALVVAVVAASLGAYWWALVLIGAGGLAAGLGAYLHISYDRPEGVSLLLVGAAVLIVMSVLAIFSVGILLLPAALAASIAAIAARRRSSDSLPHRPAGEG
jgi:hypothetical protein